MSLNRGENNGKESVKAFDTASANVSLVKLAPKVDMVEVSIKGVEEEMVEDSGDSENMSVARLFVCCATHKTKEIAKRTDFTIRKN